MNLAEIEIIKSSGSLPFTISNLILDEGFIVLNDKVAFKISLVSSSFERTNPIIIYDERGQEIGVLLLLKNKIIPLAELSDYQQVAAIIDAESESEFSRREYFYKCDYLVVDYIYFNTYINDYFQSAPIWGGFVHEEQYKSTGISNRPSNFASSIHAIKLSRFTNVYFETSIRSIAQPHAFERFLKLYHLLEVNYDYELIEEIKSLNVQQDSHKIGELLWRQEREDHKRLLFILKKYILNFNKVNEQLNLIKNHLPVAKRILFDFYKKDSCPFPESKYSVFEEIANSSDGFLSSENCKKLNRDLTHNEFIDKLLVYIIYRTRNCIAHYKIGEYLMDSTDEKYICDFAEPLLREILLQCYK